MVHVEHCLCSKLQIDSAIMSWFGFVNFESVPKIKPLDIEIENFILDKVLNLDIVFFILYKLGELSHWMGLDFSRYCIR